MAKLKITQVRSKNGATKRQIANLKAKGLQYQVHRTGTPVTCRDYQQTAGLNEFFVLRCFFGGIMLVGSYYDRDRSVRDIRNAFFCLLDLGQEAISEENDSFVRTRDIITFENENYGENIFPL